MLPMEDINLHFTGDFSAVEKANNLLSAMIDNDIQSKTGGLGSDPRTVLFKRVMDMNDRVLREVIVGLGGTGNGMPRQEGFNITPASEVMAILCLSSGIDDLKQRLGNILVGFRRDGRAVYARETGGVGAMAVLLKEAIKPNLVQTLGGSPVLIHGGPFANIAQGTNSLLATRMAMSLADYTITEAGFGSDMGAEKFMDIKCRVGGIAPRLWVVVATVRALKYHGGMRKLSSAVSPIWPVIWTMRPLSVFRPWWRSTLSIRIQRRNCRRWSVCVRSGVSVRYVPVPGPREAGAVRIWRGR